MGGWDVTLISTSEAFKESMTWVGGWVGGWVGRGERGGWNELLDCMGWVGRWVTLLSKLVER